MKKKLLSIISAASLLASFSFTVAYANNTAESSPFKLEYVAGDNATQKTVNVYYDGDDLNAYGVAAGNLSFRFSTTEISDFKYTGDIPANEIEAVPGLAEGTYGMLFTCDAGYVNNENKLLGTCTLTVPENMGEFEVTLVAAESYLMDGQNYGWFQPAEDITITIPGATVEEPKTPYAPTDLTAKRFDEHKDDVPVDAWSTTIDYDTTEVNGTLKWAISNGTNIAKVDTTVVSGEGSVVYGLFIAGQAAELDTITSVQLIAE